MTKKGQILKDIKKILQFYIIAIAVFESNVTNTANY